MNKQTQKRNAAFKAATKSERAVMVARDALKMLDKGKTKGSEGNWVNLTSVLGDVYRLDQKERNRQICDVSDLTSFVGCKVCALGSLMLSEIRHTNSLTVGGAGNQVYYIAEKDRLDAMFSRHQQMLMELAFEGGGGNFSVDDVSETESEKVLKFYRSYKTENGRLRAILKNVIKNGGEFVLPS